MIYYLLRWILFLPQNNDTIKHLNDRDCISLRVEYVVNISLLNVLLRHVEKLLTELYTQTNSIYISESF
jgi:hypothetical protein